MGTVIEGEGDGVGTVDSPRQAERLRDARHDRGERG
jgi:hypothetical protein